MNERRLHVLSSKSQNSNRNADALYSICRHIDFSIESIDHARLCLGAAFLYYFSSLYYFNYRELIPKHQYGYQNENINNIQAKLC
jgi:hypothetical protein